MLQVRVGVGGGGAFDEPPPPQPVAVAMSSIAAIATQTLRLGRLDNAPSRIMLTWYRRSSLEAVANLLKRFVAGNRRYSAFKHCLKTTLGFFRTGAINAVRRRVIQALDQ
jgi:hypothetical protein